MRHFALNPYTPFARRVATVCGATLVAVTVSASQARAQTDYYNTDAGRPITVEDAYAIERRALEIQIAPLRLERSRGGRYAWGIEPEVAVGLFPRTQVELGLPFSYLDSGGGRRMRGLAGIDVSVLHNLNVETSIPALAIAADVLLPAGPLGPDKVYPSLKGIMTRTFSWARFHVNAQYTFSERIASAGHGGELSQWLGGVAVDRTFPLESFLVTAEVVARQPLIEGENVRWDSGAGMRYQLSPRVAADAGAGYRMTGSDTGWFLTFGAAVSLGLPWTPRR
jgi:hypothetical protein